ncbi:MAG: T9SS type A sorting domain-containing protein, partial [Bacteroidales bacterium]|nr:T9SS type A sorting domain-containing protein [Bacteroidales bacterium]
YSNSEIYSSIAPNNYVGGIIGNASSSSNLTNVYSACKIIRNGTNTNFGKIKGNTQGTTGAQCYSRDNVFVNCDNITPSGYNGTSMNNAGLRNPTFATSTLGSANWKADNDSINDGYPILKYQLGAAKVNVNGPWQTASNWVGSVLPKASQVVIIPNGRQIKIVNGSAPMAAYVKIENGGTLLNNTNLNFFGEYNRELYVGKWNLIGLSTYNQSLASLINFTDTAYKTFVKTFDYTTNNWSALTTQVVNTQFKNGEGILVMPNYSLDAQLLSTSRIVSKGVLFNNDSLSYTFNNTSTATNKFVSLANNYPASLDTALLINNNSSLIQGRLIYVYDADRGEWNNNWQSTNRVTSIKPSEGFFIASASGTFNFKKSQIKNTSGAKNVIKSDLIYVKAFANNQERESFLEFNDDADNAFDFNDGLMLFGNNYSSVEPFFRINAGKESLDSENRDLHILKDAFSTLPYVTELDLRSQNDNEVSLNFSNLPPDIHVYLLDSLLRNAQYLNENADYNLKVGSGDNENRLFLLFSYKKEDINELFKPEKSEQIRIWNYNNILHIEGKDLIRYEIYDILGNRLLEEETFEDDYQKSLSLKNGIYIVRAYSKTSTKTEKISIYN